MTKPETVLQDMSSCEETLALLKLLALGQGEIRGGKMQPVEGLAARIRAR